MLDRSGLIEVANAVTAKIAELLSTPVFTTDQNGRVITGDILYSVRHSLSEEDSKKSSTKAVKMQPGSEIGTDAVVGDDSGNHEDISLRLAHAIVKLVVNQTVTQNQLPSKHELKDQLIYDLLHGQVREKGTTLIQAKHLGMDLTQPRAVILIDAANYILRNDDRSELQDIESTQRQRTQTVISSIVNFFHLPNDTICADLGEGYVCVLKASNTRNLDLWASADDASDGLSSSWANLTALKRAANALLLRLRSDTGTSINIGIGRYHPGLEGLAQSYEDAQAAISLGSRFQGHNRVHCLAELGIAAFVGVANEGTKVDLAKYLLSPLDRDPELLMTLEVFFLENCCPSSTARQLSIHRNTLSYRLDKIASLTGLEPRKFDDAVQMRLSLLLRSLQKTC